MPPTESRLPPSVTATGFAFVSALLAAITMGALETRLLDEGSYAIGVGLAAVVGFVVAHAGRRRGALAVIAAGAVVGMTIQTVLLFRLPPSHTYSMSEWVTTKDPFSWIAIGAPLGVLPAVGAACLFVLGVRLSRGDGRPAPKDAPERVLVPIAGAAALLAGVAVARARNAELAVVLIVMAVACATLLQVARVDRARMRWLGDVFGERDPAFGVVHLEDSCAPDLPLVVGGLVPATVVTNVSEAGTYYRASAGARYGVAASTLEATVTPLVRRIRLALVLAAAAPLCAGFAALAR